MDNDGADQVRVMTIHGAKGLEAPVVVLPDMLTPVRIPQLVRDPQSGFVYWAPGGVRPDFVSEARDSAREREEEEENRLLYVALTRARDGVVIGGWQAQHRRRLEASPMNVFMPRCPVWKVLKPTRMAGCVLKPKVLCQQGIGGCRYRPRSRTACRCRTGCSACSGRTAPATPLRPSQPDGRAQTARAPAQAALPPRGRWPVDGSRTGCSRCCR